MLIDSYKQESNYKRKYKLVNVSEGIDLIPFIKNRDLSYSKFEQEKDGSMSANSMSFTLTFPYSTSNLSVTSTSPMLIDAEILKNYMIDFDALVGIEEPKVTGTIPLGNLIKKGDNIILFEETENDLLVFDGIAEAPKMKRDKTHIYLTIEVKDKTYSLYEMKHLKEEFFQDIYLCSALNKSNSLIHQIAYRLGFKDEELDLPDFTTIIPFVLFKKDELIIKELAYAVRLIGGVFTIENGKLVVRAEANRVTETYVFDSRNILSEINIDPIYPNYDKLKITYDYYFEKAKQDMWILVGENGNLNDANVVVRAGQDRKFSVDWLYNVDLVKEYELYEVVFTKVDSTIINFPYALNIDETGGTLELNNTANNYDVYVKKFKIRGIPLFMQQGNESYYPSNIESEKLLDNLENKLAQNSDLALLYLKANYNENCKLYKSLSFSTNVNNYLEPCRKIWFDHKFFTGYIIIEKVDFQGTKMSIQAREYLEPININDIKTLEKSSVDEYEVISNKFLTEKGLYEADLPLAPQNLLLISQALGFTITFDNFSSNLRGHFVYLKKKTDVDWMKFFINTNNYFYQTVEMLTYEVKVSSVSINGVEGETTEVKEVIPIRLHNGVVDYPEGFSPAELDTKVQTINSHIVDITDELSLHEVNIELIEESNSFQNQKIETIEADITQKTLRISAIEDSNAFQNQKIELVETEIISMKETDENNFTAIQQNAQQIQNIAQEVATKTTENQVQTITNTAIESFSANEFRRTLGTRVSVIDYSDNIDEIENLDIDSNELEEVMIEDYYSSIFQNSREILSLIKTSDEHYSSILQLVDSITMLVQEDNNAKSLIQQLSDEITLLVQKDNENYTSIRQNAEEIQNVALRTTANENNITQQATQIIQNADSITALAQDLNEANTKIEQNSTEIISTAQTAEGAMSKATQNADSISNLVTKTDGQATQINQNAEQIESIAQRTLATEDTNYQQATAITQNAEQIQSIAQEVSTKTTENQVQTITNTAIESFSANEFRRTLGTRVSIIDYSDNIDEIENLDIDDVKLEEVMIEDYYSSIFQNSREILSLIKTSDEHYSSILQLVDSITMLVQEDNNAKSLIQQLSDEITLLVQKDDENYTLIEQLTDELTFVVKKDNLISSINQTAEEIQINAARIALGNGLVVEGDQVAVRDLGAENIRGNRLEGVEIVSENATMTERVIMNYGKVTHQKRATVLDDYKTYDQLIMHVTGEVSCPKAWSSYIDLKSSNGDQAWSSLNLIYFIGNQYELDAGIATSREIIKEWENNDPTTQKVRFKVCGNANVTTNTTMVGKILRTSSSIIVPSVSIVNFGITVTAHVQTTYVGGSIGNIYNRSRTIVYVQFDNEAEQVLLDIPQDTSVQKSGGTYEGLLMTKTASLYKDFLTNVKTFKLRVESYYYFSQSGNTYYGEPTISFTGSYTTMNFVQDKLFDATVNWLAIGNS